MTALTGPTVKVRRPKLRVDMGALRREVFTRDKACLGYLHSPGHICRDAFGTSHSPFALNRMSLEHVHTEGLQMGLRAPSDPRHCVTVCYGLNGRPPSHEQREFFREHLRRMYPE